MVQKHFNKPDITYVTQVEKITVMLVKLMVKARMSINDTLSVKISSVQKFRRLKVTNFF